MLERIRKARETESGFTLIELLIVIVVLGILAAIVLFGVGTFSSDSKKSACNADTRNLQIAEAAYYAAHSQVYADQATLVSGGYLESAPTSGASVTATTGSATAPTYASC